MSTTSVLFVALTIVPLMTACALDDRGVRPQSTECTGELGCVLAAGSRGPATSGASSIDPHVPVDSGAPTGPVNPPDATLTIAACGNSLLDPGETCDPPASCPTEETCRTTDGCLTGHLLGSAETCDAVCSTQETTVCTSGDGCCAKGCKYPEDADCSMSCGDGVVDPPELCEPSSEDKPCPTSCDDGNLVRST